MSKKYAVIWMMIICFLIVGFRPIFAADERTNKQKKQDAVLAMRDEVLAELYKGKPEAKAQIQKAPGYAVFDNSGMHLLLLSSSKGNGVAVDSNAKKNVFMKMKTVGAGPGLGVKDYQVVFIFKTPATMNKFMEAGWSFTGEADAAAKNKEEGAAAGAQASSTEGMDIYTITKKGIALQATLGGTKFKKDDELN
jgi:lipid-binding SYLF domain-containing protein